MNKAKIKLYSETKNTLTDKQMNLIESLLVEAENINVSFLKEFSLEEDGSFLVPLINKEAVFSGYIENSRTNVEDLAYDIEEINNSFSWESRNIINVYKRIFIDLEKDIFFFSKQTLQTLHVLLYDTHYKNYKLTYDAQQIIKKVKPGKIISPKDSQNWIGIKTGDIESDLKTANLIPISPQYKEKYIQDLFKTIENKIKDNEITMKDVIIFHPHFEAIHPFADGNGRIGRALMVALLSKKGLPKWLALNISRVFYNRKEEYFNALEKYATQENVFLWNSFFISVLIEAKYLMEKQTLKFWTSYSKYKNQYKNKETHFEVFKYFIKFYKVHKPTVISNLLNKGISSSTAYKSFNDVVEDIKAIKEHNYYMFTEGNDIWE